MAQSLTKRFTDRVSAHLGKRSKHWPRVRNEYHDEYPECAACGSTKRTQVHHIQDFSTTPELELDWDNLMTLCMHNKCHILLGHLGNFQSINPDVKKMAPYLWNKIVNRR